MADLALCFLCRTVTSNFTADQLARKSPTCRPCRKTPIPQPEPIAARNARISSELAAWATAAGARFCFGQEVSA